MKIIGINEYENSVLDSIPYQSSHINLKSIEKTNYEVSEILLRKGFLKNELTALNKINDTLFHSIFRLGIRTNSIGINENDNEIRWIKIFEIEEYLDNIIKKEESNGYSLSQIKLENFRNYDDKLIADLSIIKEKKRVLDEIVINGYEKFPISHKKNIQRLYKNKIFNKDKLEKINKDFEKIPFISIKRYPEILFTNDSTKAFVFIEKTNSNSFDGYIGFSNDNEKDGKIILNGYLDIILSNLTNSGETLKINWKNDGKKQTLFDAAIELPYIFNSTIGVKGSLNIFKQDSIFQNTKTSIAIGHYFNYNTKIFAGYQSTESSDISNLNNNFISDFNNQFYTLSFEHKEILYNDLFFREKSTIDFKIGKGSRTTFENSDSQILIEGAIKNLFSINEKNKILIKLNALLLDSENYLNNELFRFGGMQNLRGFQENSLSGNFFTSINTQYIYVLTNSFYINPIFDYGYYQDDTNNFKEKLFGYGAGLGLRTSSGILNLIYAKGSKQGENKQKSNSIIHISLNLKF